MPDTISELRTRIEAADTRWAQKIDALTSDVQDKIESSQTKLEQKIDRQATDQTAAIDNLKATVDADGREIASIKATIATSKLIVTVAGLIVAVVGVVGGGFGFVGINEILKDRQNLKDVIQRVETDKQELSALLQKTQVVTEENALIAQEASVDKLEMQLNSAPSLDTLRDRPGIRTKIRELSAKVKDSGARISDQNRSSTYYWMADALDLYLTDNFAATLKVLDRIKENDRDRFAYSYMRGVSLLRTGKSQEAEEWLQRASTLTEGKRIMMAMNAQGASKLFQWKASPKGEYLDRAVEIFDSVIRMDKTFDPAYFNRACAFALKKDYIAVTRALKEMHEVFPAARVVDRIREDISRPSESFLTEYVEQYLKVVLPPNDIQWESSITHALNF